MSLLSFLEEKKAQFNLKTIRRRVKDFNLEIHQHGNDTITTNSLCGIKIVHNSHNNEETITLNNQIISKKENTIDGVWYSELNPEKIKALKDNLENTITSNLENSIHKIDIDNAVNYLSKNFKIINTGNHNSYNEKGCLILENKIGDVSFTQKTYEEQETCEFHTVTSISINNEVVFDQKSTFDNKDKENIVIGKINSKKLIEAQKNVENTIKASFEKKNDRRFKM